MGSIGEMLREARHQKQVALEDASRVTKIKVDILEKLEADDFSGLVSPTYTRGFLKLYADYLGLDGAGIAAAYVQNQGGLRRQGLHVETVAATRSRRLGELNLPVGRVAAGVALLTLLVVGVSLGYRWWTRPPPPVATPTPPVVTVPAALPRAEFEAVYQPARKPAPALVELSGQ